jgi:hypothetical protein
VLARLVIGIRLKDFGGMGTDLQVGKFKAHHQPCILCRGQIEFRCAAAQPLNDSLIQANDKLFFRLHADLLCDAIYT